MVGRSVTPDIDPETQALLARYGFDAEAFERMRRHLASVRAADIPASSRIAGQVVPPEPEDVLVLPSDDRPSGEANRASGEQALAAGQVGLVVLAGGMATRFGGAVKAATEVMDGHSFLELKVAVARAVAARVGARLPMFLMTSFATAERVGELAARLESPEVPIATFAQSVSLRLTPEGALFREADGKPSLSAPGHGDLLGCLRKSGTLARFAAQGGRWLLVSNVDNLGATPDPAVVGAHLRAGRPVTVEVTHKEPGDKGGAPARVEGVLQIVESFRFPADFDQDQIPVFNTNSFVFDAAAIDRDFPLTWFLVPKDIGGRVAVQLERLVGQVTAFLPAQYLQVPRAGPASRFLPVKDPDELERRRPDIRQVLAAHGVAL